MKSNTLPTSPRREPGVSLETAGAHIPAAPWRVVHHDDDSNRVVVAGVCEVWPTSKGTAAKLATAHLIAAAPDLLAALAFVRELIELAGDAPWYLENPVSIISTKIREPSQTIQPHDFGEDASKRTCLWLNRLPLLRGTVRVPGRMVEWPRGSGKMVERWSNQTDSGQNKLPPSRDRWKVRSKTYAGIARAMADQWHALLAGPKEDAA
jgi:hypothetical protein